MSTIKIKLFSAEPYDESTFNCVNEKFGFQIDYHPEKLTCDNIILAKGADVVCVFVDDIITAAMIDHMAEYGVKLIALRCSGFNNVDLKEAKDKIPVVRVPAYSPGSIAEFALAMMLALNRKIYRAYWRTREGNFSLEGLVGFEMKGKTVGAIGTGHIARSLIPVLLSMGMLVIANDPYPDWDLQEKYGIEYVKLEDLYQKSDIITLHCPLTPTNHYMIDQKAIEMMKPGVMIINTGRGKLIHTAALIEGLKNKKIGSAGLDVYEEESEYFYHDYSDKIIDDDILEIGRAHV